MYVTVLYYVHCVFLFFFFKQKTAYEMRISDWSSDVCSSDLRAPAGPDAAWPQRAVPAGAAALAACAGVPAGRLPAPGARAARLPVGVGDAVCGLEIGRASCRERVCQYV